MTLEAQYKKYLIENPNSTYTYEEWKEKVLKPFLEDAIKQVEQLTKDL